MVDKGHCQIETFYKKQRSYSGSELWLVPACNPFGAELTLGRNRIEGDRNTILQAKIPFKGLQTNGVGFAASLGSFGGDAYVNSVASVSFLDDHAVVHGNLGAFDHTGVRYALMPKRLQTDATLGWQSAVPERRFHSIGMRISY